MGTITCSLVIYIYKLNLQEMVAFGRACTVPPAAKSSDDRLVHTVR